jgi:hypothetical protein
MTASSKMRDFSLQRSIHIYSLSETNTIGYYCDARLHEYRNVENPHDRWPLDIDITDTPALGSGLERMSPQAITREEWAEIASLPQIRNAWGLDAQTTPEEFANVCYGARFDFQSGGSGYSGDLYMLYGDAISGVPIILIRDAEHRLQVIENEEEQSLAVPRKPHLMVGFFCARYTGCIPPNSGLCPVECISRPILLSQISHNRYL